MTQLVICHLADRRSIAHCYGQLRVIFHWTRFSSLSTDNSRSKSKRSAKEANLKFQQKTDVSLLVNISSFFQYLPPSKTVFKSKNNFIRKRLVKSTYQLKWNQKVQKM